MQIHSAGESQHNARLPVVGSREQVSRSLPIDHETSVFSGKWNENEKNRYSIQFNSIQFDSIHSDSSRAHFDRSISMAIDRSCSRAQVLD